MTTLYLLDVPENQGVVDVAAHDATLHVNHVGPYVAVTCDDALIIDRRATGSRHAVWYSCVAGVAGGTITQWDKDALRIDAVHHGPAGDTEREMPGFQDAGLPA